MRLPIIPLRNSRCDDLNISPDIQETSIPLEVNRELRAEADYKRYVFWGINYEKLATLLWRNRVLCRPNCSFRGILLCTASIMAQIAACLCPFNEIIKLFTPCETDGPPRVLIHARSFKTLARLLTDMRSRISLGEINILYLIATILIGTLLRRNINLSI